MNGKNNTRTKNKVDTETTKWKYIAGMVTIISVFAFLSIAAVAHYVFGGG